MKCIIAVIAVAVMAACVNGAGRFEDKKVLVTGGSSGIGYQTAMQFAREGAAVIICGRDANSDHYTVEGACEVINNDPTVVGSHGSCRPFKADVSKATGAASLFESIRQEEGYIDIAINSAGISGPVGKLGDTAQYTLGEHDPILNNVYSVMYCLAEEEAMFVANNINGSIVTVSSVHGITPNSKLPRFSASKYSIIGLTNSIALKYITGENGPYIRANTVAPSSVATPHAFNLVKDGQQPWEGEWVTEDSDTWKNALPKVVEHIPMQRVARPEEIANTILWLCTDDAQFISADVIGVDGGTWAC